MEFIKRNYEKIILSLVLLGLVGVLVAMWFVIAADQQQMADMRDHVTHPKTVPLPDLDLSRQQAVMSRLQSPNNLDLSTTNKVFNPVSWQRTADGRLMRASKTGPGAAVITKITPLYYTITLDSVTTNEAGARYVFGIEDQTAAIPAQRHKRPHYASLGKGNDTVTDKSVGGKNEGFTLKEVKGPPENPDPLVLMLADTQAPVTLSKDKPFRRTDGYSADLKYDLGNFSRAGLRVGDHLSFAGDDYNVIDIQSNAVILLAQSNQKKITLPYTP
jgi:hypothetical protein